MNPKVLNSIKANFKDTARMPVLFLGHGSPMNAIQENEFTKGWRQTAKSIPIPQAILCISAHWETNGTYVTAVDKPRTIHDFGGFPPALYQVEYPAPGDPLLASGIRELVQKTAIGFDHNWGLDHGSWSVLRHLYPSADIPVLQLSLHHRQNPQWHYELARELSALRNKGVLIVGSGNIVHNLRMLNWQSNTSYDWAVEANEQVKSHIRQNEHKALINYQSIGRSMELAVPSPEHFLPLLYILGLKEESESVSFFNDKTELGSISMTSVLIGEEV